MTINELCAAAHSDAKAKGWYDDGERNFGELLMLVVSELGECLEAHRNNRWSGVSPSKCMKILAVDEYNKRIYAEEGVDNGVFESQIKDTIEDELADAVIRISDLCGYLRIDLESHIIAKMKYNRTRPRKHGKEY